MNAIKRKIEYGSLRKKSNYSSFMGLMVHEQGEEVFQKYKAQNKSSIFKLIYDSTEYSNASQSIEVYESFLKMATDLGSNEIVDLNEYNVNDLLKIKNSETKSEMLWCLVQYWKGKGSNSYEELKTKFMAFPKVKALIFVKEDQFGEFKITFNELISRLYVKKKNPLNNEKIFKFCTAIARISAQKFNQEFLQILIFNEKLDMQLKLKIAITACQAGFHEILKKFFDLESEKITEHNAKQMMIAVMNGILFRKESKSFREIFNRIVNHDLCFDIIYTQKKEMACKFMKMALEFQYDEIMLLILKNGYYIGRKEYADTKFLTDCISEELFRKILDNCVTLERHNQKKNMKLFKVDFRIFFDDKTPGTQNQLEQVIVTESSTQVESPETLGIRIQLQQGIITEPSTQVEHPETPKTGNQLQQEIVTEPSTQVESPETLETGNQLQQEIVTESSTLLPNSTNNQNESVNESASKTDVELKWMLLILYWILMCVYCLTGSDIFEIISILLSLFLPSYVAFKMIKQHLLMDEKEGINFENILDCCLVACSFLCGTLIILKFNDFFNIILPILLLLFVYKLHHQFDKKVFKETKLKKWQAILVFLSVNAPFIVYWILVIVYLFNGSNDCLKLTLIFPYFILSRTICYLLKNGRSYLRLENTFDLFPIICGVIYGMAIIMENNDLFNITYPTLSILSLVELLLQIGSKIKIKSKDECLRNPLQLIADSEKLKKAIDHPVLITYIEIMNNKFAKYNQYNFVIFVISWTMLLLSIGMSLLFNSFKLLQYCLYAPCIIFVGVRESIQIILFGKLYFRSVVNWIEFSIVLSGVVGFCNSFREDKTIFHVSRAILMILTVLELILLWSKIWKYILITMCMFLRVTKLYGQLILIFGFVLIGFSLSFILIFSPTIQEISSKKQNVTNDSLNEKDEEHVAKNENEFNKFQNFFYTILKVLIMLTGEFDASDLEIQYWPRFIFFVIFVFVAVAVFNFMNALAIEEVDGLKKGAELLILKVKLETIIDYENHLLKIKNYFGSLDEFFLGFSKRIENMEEVYVELDESSIKIKIMELPNQTESPLNDDESTDKGKKVKFNLFKIMDIDRELHNKLKDLTYDKYETYDISNEAICIQNDLQYA